MIARFYRLTATAAAAASILVPTAAAQSSSVTASVIIAAPQPTCTASDITNLHFGTIIRPSTTTATDEYVEISETAATVSTSTGISDPASFSVGYLKITAVNTTSFTISRTFPSDLDALTFTGAWAKSDFAGSGYTTISGDSDTQSGLGGEGQTAVRHYRFGGRVADIAHNTTLGTYDDTISLSVTCLQ